MKYNGGMSLEDRAELYVLLVKYSTKKKEEVGSDAHEINKFDECAVEILSTAKKRGEAERFEKLIKF